MAARDQLNGGINRELLAAAIKFNAVVLGLVCGTVAALTIYITTQVSLAKWGADAGGYLGLLSVFLPGYTPSAGGALIGAFWAFVFAGLAGSLTYRWYGSMLGEDIAAAVSASADDNDPVFKPVILRLSGAPLGVAIGVVMGGALLLTTTWLVLRGTADSSEHAALLANYLPGYTVSIMGAVLGAAELFLLVFACCVILAFIYNKVVDLRHGKV